MKTVVLVSLLCFMQSCVYRCENVLGKDGKIETFPSVVEAKEALKDPKPKAWYKR